MPTLNVTILLHCALLLLNYCLLVQEHLPCCCVCHGGYGHLHYVGCKIYTSHHHHGTWRHWVHCYFQPAHISPQSLLMSCLSLFPHLCVTFLLPQCSNVE